MARGDITVFDKAVLALMGTVHDLDNNEFKVKLITDAVTASAEDDTTNEVLYTEVSGGGYTAGGEVLVQVSLSESGGVTTFDFSSDPAWSESDTGFEDAYQLVCYNNTAASKDALFFMDLEGPVGNVSGPMSVTWNESGVIQGSSPAP